MTSEAMPHAKAQRREEESPKKSFAPSRLRVRIPAPVIPREIIALAVLLFLTDLRAQPAEPRFTIEQLTSIFENDTPRLRYAYCENIHDGRGLTFGFAGFTSGTFDGTLFLEEYRRLHPGNPLERYLPAFRRIDAGPHDDAGRNASTAGLVGFARAFRKLGSDPAFADAQQNLVDHLYWEPSQRLARRIGARLAITRGQLYDACINLGEDGLLDLIQRTNAARDGPPKSGAVSESAWLGKFLDLRLADLRQGDRIERAAADRVRVYQRLLAQKNLRLRKPIRLRCYGDDFNLR